MIKYRLCIFLVSVGLVILLGLAIVQMCKHPPLFYYRQFTELPRELPTRLIRRAFWIVTGQQLPSKADGLRAIFQGGREPAIFVRFQTDSEGIKYILETFGGPGVESTTYDADFLKALSTSRANIFPILPIWQEKLGICLYDQESIESGRELKFISGGVEAWYTIFIDDQRDTVYISSCQH
jgi:hypothetical protein